MIATASEAMPTPPTIKIHGPLSMIFEFQEPASWPVKTQPPVSVTSTPTALAIAPAIDAAQNTPTGTSCSRLNSSGYFDRMIKTSTKRKTIDRHQMTVTAAWSALQMPVDRLALPPETKNATAEMMVVIT